MFSLKSFFIFVAFSKIFQSSGVFGNKDYSADGRTGNQNLIRKMSMVVAAPSSTKQPVFHPTSQPTSQPSKQPASHPTSQPSKQPSSQPTSHPTQFQASSYILNCLAYGKYLMPGEYLVSENKLYYMIFANINYYGYEVNVSITSNIVLNMKLIFYLGKINCWTRGGHHRYLLGHRLHSCFGI
jgi:hypothetical protein